MKKLLITTMAAVSVGLCAKAADDGFISGTSFEDVSEGAYLEKNEKNGTVELCKWYDADGNDLSTVDYADIWMTAATDAQLVVSNLSRFAGDYLPNADRPQQWSGGDNTKALYIDTDKPLMRYVNPSTDGKTAAGADLNQDIFFDSVVQFTATDVAAEPESGDKLRVWLYTSPENLDGTVFGEEEAITRLVVTAGYYKPNDATTYKTNYLTNVSISPDSWHRLTIKTFVVGGRTKFNIYVDGDIVKIGDLQDFDSLFKVDGQDTLQCVAFDGKGAVDDIVFTTKDPFAVASYKVTTSLSEEADIEGAVISAEYKLDSGEYNELALSGTLTLPETTTDFTAKLWISEGAKLVGGTKKADEVDADGNYAWYISYDPATFKKDGTDSIVFEVIVDDGTEEPVQTYAVSVVANALEATVGGLSAEYAEGNVVTFTVVAATGYTIEGVAVAGANTTPVLTPNGNTYTFTMPAEAVTITVTTKAIEEEVTYPSVGGVETPEYSVNAKAAIDAAFPDNSYPTDGLTVKVNGEVLAGAKAVEMLNEAVEMFTLADDAKFFNEDGVMEISFKATSADPDTIAYEATVGKATATVKDTSYEVVPKYIDIATNTELSAKPTQGSVTFRLVIQKKTPTPAQ